ncbi:MAG TPA: hypothetical protein VMB72_15110 [Acidimicrobiales bacterium]|nr:hypothetical protein [Acidimicrobiales bacterium]
MRAAGTSQSVVRSDSQRQLGSRRRARAPDDGGACEGSWEVGVTGRVG